jgi:hypothetical protein
VTIGADWSVDTGHDLDAERVAVAFGGYSSCLELVERVVPAARVHLQLLARRTPVHLARQRGGRWAAATVTSGCCTRGVTPSYATPEKAVEHVLTSRHQASLAGCRADLLKHVSAQLVRAHCGGRRTFDPSDVELREADTRVVEGFGARRLWDSGLHPRLVALIHRVASPAAVPLPMSFYLGVVTERPDLHWVRRTLEHLAGHAPAEGADCTAETADCLSWSYTPQDASHPLMRREFLALGLPWPVIQQLTAARVRPHMVQQVAEVLRFSPPFAASTIVAWMDAGVHVEDAPELKWLLQCYTAGAPQVWRPSRAALQALKSEVRSGWGLTPGNLCAVLGVAGTVHFAAAAINEGIDDPAQVHDWLHRDVHQPVLR